MGFMLFCGGAVRAAGCIPAVRKGGPPRSFRWDFPLASFRAEKKKSQIVSLFNASMKKSATSKWMLLSILIIDAWKMPLI